MCLTSTSSSCLLEGAWLTQRRGRVFALFRFAPGIFFFSKECVLRILSLNEAVDRERALATRLLGTTHPVLLSSQRGLEHDERRLVPAIFNWGARRHMARETLYPRPLSSLLFMGVHCTRFIVPHALIIRFLLPVGNICNVFSLSLLSMGGISFRLSIALYFLSIVFR